MILVVALLVAIVTGHKCRCGYYCHDPVLHSLPHGQLLPSLLCVEPEFAEESRLASRMPNPVARFSPPHNLKPMPTLAVHVNREQHEGQPPVYLRTGGTSESGQSTEDDFS
jgi:hypothetical protein